MNRYLALQKIIELGNFTKASASLGYTQSSVSQMIASLEKELCLKLLNRSRAGIKLTIEGEELYPYIEKAIQQYRAIQEKADEIRGLETGIIRVGTISSVTCHWMPQLIRGFQKDYPNVQFLFHQGDYRLIPEWIRNGTVDFGFVTPPAANGLEIIPIKRGEMMAVLPVDHTLSSKAKVSLADLTKDPFILLEEGSYNEPAAAFQAAGLTPNVRYTIHDDWSIMTMVEAGLGISILAELMLRRTNFNILCLPIDPPIYRELAIGYKDRYSLPIASKYFIDHLLANADLLP